MGSRPIRPFGVAWCAIVVFAGCAGAGSPTAPTTGIAGYAYQRPPLSVASHRVPDVKSKKTTATLKAGGGKIDIAKFNTFDGNLTYAKNDAKHAVTLTLTNSGSTNLESAPTPSGHRPVLFLTAQIGGKAKVAFKSSASKALIRSASLVADAPYTLYLYQRKAQIGKIAAGSASAKGELSFATPLANRTIAPNTPLVMELVNGSKATPTPSPTSSPTPTPTPGPLTATPTSLTFSSAATQTFSVQESNYSGTLTATSSNTAVATVSPSSGGGPSATFTVTPVGGGTCTITVQDTFENSTTVQVTVNNGIIIIDRSKTKRS